MILVGVEKIIMLMKIQWSDVHEILNENEDSIWIWTTGPLSYILAEHYVDVDPEALRKAEFEGG